MRLESQLEPRLAAADRQIEQLELRLEDLEAAECATPIEIPKTLRTAPEQVKRKQWDGRPHL